MNLTGRVEMVEKIEIIQSFNFIKFAEDKSWSQTKNSFFLHKQIENNVKRFNALENKIIQNDDEEYSCV